MMMKTRMFIAKSFAKKHYKGAMDAMKSLKSKIKKPTGMKEKAMAAGSKVKTFAKKNKVALAVGGGAATVGSVAGYQSGKSKERKRAKSAIMRAGLAEAAGDLGIKTKAYKTTPSQRRRIIRQHNKNVDKKLKQYRSFYS